MSVNPSLPWTAFLGVLSSGWTSFCLMEVGTEPYVEFGEDPQTVLPRTAWQHVCTSFSFSSFFNVVLFFGFSSRFHNRLDKGPVLISAGLTRCLDVLVFLFLLPPSWRGCGLTIWWWTVCVPVGGVNQKPNIGLVFVGFQDAVLLHMHSRV